MHTKANYYANWASRALMQFVAASLGFATPILAAARVPDTPSTSTPAIHLTQARATIGATRPITPTENSGQSRATKSPNDKDRVPLAQNQPATPSIAQTEPPAPAQAPAASLEQVVVTGSHIPTTTFTTPTPVTVVNKKTIQSLGLVNVGDVLNLIPANSNITSTANLGLANFYIGSQFANLRGLNPFFGTRTLTLVNSQRFVPTAAGGQVDLNEIPSIMIQRVETVTGGASAAYGSDAVAGVVNIITDNSFKGFKAQIDGGETTYSDDGDIHAALEWGSSFFGGRIHNVIGAEYEDSMGIGVCGKVRPWCEAAPAQFTNTGYTTNGMPHYIIGYNGTEFYPTTGLLQSFSAPFTGGGGYLGMFNAAGTALVPFNQGIYGSGAGRIVASQNGSGPNFYDNVTIRAPVVRWSLYDHSNAELPYGLKATLDLSFAQRRTHTVNSSDGPTGFPVSVVYPNNPYLPPTVAAAMGGSPAWFTANTINQLSRPNINHNYTGRAVLGLEGKFFAGWKWKAYYEFGENTTSEVERNDLVVDLALSPVLTGTYPPTNPPTYDFLNWSLNAVTNPATGQIVCAATLPTIGGNPNPAYSPLAAGCVPINLFGANSASPAALAYIYRDLHQNSVFTQQVASFNTHGNLFPGVGAGPFVGAVGFEYRHNMADVTHDLANTPWYNQLRQTLGEDYSGNIDVVAGYVEINMPFLKNVSAAKYLAFDVAGRESHYENKNTTPTGLSENFNFPSWKFSLVYNPVDWLRLRADRSRDTRAPSFYELWSQTTSNGGLFGTVPNPWLPGHGPGQPNFGRAVDPAIVTNGAYDSSLGLRPEEADTTTLGLVLTPTTNNALDELQLSVDWYQVIITDAIGEIGGIIGGTGAIINGCYQGLEFYCQFIQGTPNSTGGFQRITAVQHYNLNLGHYTTRGYDFEVDYRLPFDQFWSGRSDSLDFRVLATYQYDQTIDPGQGLPAVNYAGQTGPAGIFAGFNPLPKWQGNAFVTYNNGPFTGVLQVHVIGSGTFQVVDPNTGLPMLGPGQPGYNTTYGASISNNTVASMTYFNLSLNYTLPFFNHRGKSLQLFGSLKNIFNRYPPIAPGGNGYPTNPVYFDTFGRTWRVGLRLTL